MGAGIKMVANNKKAYHDYFIDDKFEAGIELFGTEVKSIRMGKCSIKEAFIKLLNEKPLAQISVRMIVEECGINRNSFYYHFQDIYDLVEWACYGDAKKALKNKKTHDTWQQGLTQLLYAVRDNKPFIINVYNCVDKGQVEKYLKPLTDDLLLGVVEEESINVNVREEDKKFIAQVYSYCFVGIMLDWIKNDMKEKPEDLVERLALVLDGDIGSALARFNLSK